MRLPGRTHGAAAAPPTRTSARSAWACPARCRSINARALELGDAHRLALHCAIPPFSKFDRKNYHYPDLMKGYQISQYDLPSGERRLAGDRDARGGPSASASCASIWKRTPPACCTARDADGAPYSLMDVNRARRAADGDRRRAGHPSPEEARLYLMKLRQILRYIGASTGNMEEGSFRCDANVRCARPAQAEFGTKVEIKNMNSFRAVAGRSSTRSRARAEC